MATAGSDDCIRTEFNPHVCIFKMKVADITILIDRPPPLSVGLQGYEQERNAGNLLSTTAPGTQKEKQKN